MSDLRLAQIEAALAALTRSIDLLGENDQRLASALSSLHRRMQLQEAGTAMYEIHQDRSLN